MRPKIIFSDFDGTLTNKELIDPVIFEIISWVRHKEIPFVILTGRSLSWGHFLVTHFPFSIVVVENGGAIVSKDHKGEIKTDCLIDENDILSLKKAAKNIVKRFPLSADSFGRLTDRAIELASLSKQDIEEILDDFKKNGINYSVSSIHINFSTGNQSKPKAADEVLRKFYPKIQRKECLFFGDSLNDEEMFKEYPECVGVSNIEYCQEQLKFLPKTILKGRENEGPNGVLGFLRTI